MRLFWMGCLVAAIVAACSSWGTSPVSTSIADRPLAHFDCDQITAHMDSEIACVEVPPDVILLQTLEGTQSTLQASGLSLTFDSTIYWTAVAGDGMAIAIIEGICVVGIGGRIHVVHPGTQIVISLDEGLTIGQSTSPIVGPYDLKEIAYTPLDELPREVDLPAPIVLIEDPTLEATVPVLPETTETPTPVADECAVREDWGYFYTVHLGDNLSRIARRHDISLAELQEGNCITDPDRIREGQVLRVPSGGSLTIAVTATPGAVFYASNTHLRPEACTTLYWTANEAGVVYLEDSPVAQDSSQEICPRVTTSYTLRVYYLSGAQQDYTLTIFVEGNS